MRAARALVHIYNLEYYTFQQLIRHCNNYSIIIRPALHALHLMITRLNNLSSHAREAVQMNEGPPRDLDLFMFVIALIMAYIPPA